MPLLALEEARVEFGRGLEHNSHTEEICVLLLGFTGIIFSAVFAFGLMSGSDNVGALRAQLIQDSLAALAVSAGLSAVPLITVSTADVGMSAALLRVPFVPKSAAELAVTGDYLRRLYVNRAQRRADDLLLDSAIVALVDGLVFSVLSLIDPPPNKLGPVPLNLILVLGVAGASFGLLLPRFLKTMRRVIEDRNQIQWVKLLTTLAIVESGKSETDGRVIPREQLRE